MLRIGVLGGAEIAHRMFIPALLKTEGIQCTVIASRQEKRRKQFEEDFEISTVSSYEEVLENPNIDAVYIPLPPALHYKWAKKALENNKHVFLEKPSTTSYEETKELVRLAEKRGLAIQENYMFQYHGQLQKLLGLLNGGIVGDIRSYRVSFGFPLRNNNDFRYKKELGGGALLDAGGYVTKLARILLGESIYVKAAELNGIDGYDVDMFGNVLFGNDKGETAYGSFSMDCYYQCALEAWGNKGKLFTNRIFTAPPRYVPTVKVETVQGTEEITLQEDNHFKKSIEQFKAAVEDDKVRKAMALAMEQQSQLVSDIRRKSHD